MEEDILRKIQEFCQQIPYAVIGGIVSALREHPTDSASNFDRCLASCWLNVATASTLQELMRKIPNPDQLATALETGAYIAKSSASQSRFVMSGPVHTLTDTRKTEQVLLDIIQNATKNILLVSFAAYRVPSLAQALHAAIERGVCIRFILETVEDSAGQLTYDAKSAFDSLSRAKFYHWPIEKRQINASGKPGKMHAKCALNDDSFFITSANLTNDAITNNIELGIFEKDKYKAEHLLSYFNNLISNKIFVTY